MVALFFLGWTIEKNTENWQYLSVYFLSGVVGNISFFMPFVGYTKGVVGIGASAAISGLVGLGIFVCPSKFVVFPSLVPLPFVLAGALYFLATLSNLFIPSEIAHPAHLFGLATGAVFGLAWGENRVKRLFIFIFLVLLILALPYIIRYVFRRIV
jgi:membrane associated rhomboid family serine protease